MTEFKINKFITLKLEKGKTNIYINGVLFNQCKYILTRKKISELQNLLEIESVDELTENLDHSLENIEPQFLDIPVETQFWVHCSNLQVWAENNYDTRLLHSNLAFPLLKKLTESGDPIAKKVFKEEIAKRLEKGIVSTIIFLFYEGYEYFLDKEEINMIMHDKSSTLFENLIKYLSHQDRDETLVEVILDFLDELEIDVTLKAKIIKLLKTEDENVLIELIIRDLIGYLENKDLEMLINDARSKLKENLIEILNPKNLENNFKRKNFLVNFLRNLIEFFENLNKVIDVVKLINEMPEEHKKNLCQYLLHNLRGYFYYNKSLIDFIFYLYKALELDKLKEIEFEKKRDKFILYYL